MKQKLLNSFRLRVAMLVAVLCAVANGTAWADPTVLFHETFGNNTGSARDWSDSYSVKSGVSAVYSGITGYTVSNAKQGKNTTGSTQSGLNQSTSGTDAYIIIGPLNVSDYESLAVTYQWKAASIKGTYTTKLYYKTSSGGTFSEVSGSGTGATTFVERSYSLPDAAEVSTLYLKIVWNTSNTQAIIDEVELTGTASAGGTCSTPTFSPSAGAVASGTAIAISSTSGATIYYTTDGSTPTTSSTVYDSEDKPTVTSATTFKAYAVKDGLEDSEVATASYTIAKVATPTFSPGAGAVDKDAEITISCDTEGATIYYTTDGSTPTTSSTVYDSEDKPTIDDDKTIKAIAVKANYLDSEVGSATYTYYRLTDYNLVTSASQIVSGKHYLIASGTSGSGVKVMDVQNSNNRGIKAVTFSGSTLQVTGAREFVIQGPDADGYYTFYDNDATDKGYLYAASSSSNYLKTKTTIDNNARWSISISSNVASITARGSYTRNVMQYNSSSSLFSCYASASQSAVYLFVKDGEATPTESVEVTSAGYATYASDNALDFTGKSIEAYYATTKGDGTGVNFTRIYKVPAREGVLLHADGGATLDIPTLEGAASAVTNNKFVRGAGAAVATDGSTVWNYILNNIGGNIGFYKAAGQTVAKNRAYLSILKSESAAVKEFIALPGFDDATAIDSLTPTPSPVSEGSIYNLAGQRMSRLQKGVNIVNGKKVLVK